MKKSHFLVIGDFYVILGDFLCHFWWFFGWNWGPAILRQNPNKIAVLYGCGFGSKMLGLGQARSLGQNPNFDRKCFLGAPLNRSGKGIMCDMTETETETTLEMKRSPLAANLINLCRSTYSNFTGNNIHIFVEAQFSKEIIVAKKPKNFCCNGSS